MNHLQTRGIIRELARKYGITTKHLENIVGTFPEFIRLMISEEVDRENGKYPVFYVRGLGTFYVKETVKERVMKKLKEKRENNESISI